MTALDGPATLIRLVVVDDHPVVRDGLTGMFADDPGVLVVGEAGSGPEAAVVVRRSDPDGGRPVLVLSALAVLSSRPSETALSVREAEVLRLVAEGLTNGAIARRLLISESTVKTHLLHVYAKLKVTDRASAVRVAWERDLV